MIALDGTPNKAKLGANAILAVSLATAKAAASQLGLPLFKYLGGPNAKVLPVPMMNIVNGGAHSDAPMDFQEFMIVPKNFDTFSEALRAGAEIFHALKGVLKGRGLSTAVGDEGGFAPNFNERQRRARDDRHGGEEGRLQIRQGCLHRARCRLVGILRQGEEAVRLQEVRRLEAQRRGTGRLLRRACRRNSRSSRSKTAARRTTGTGWKKLTDKMGATTQLVGDDLFVTNVEFLRKGIDTGTANSILVKVNQIGSLTETLDAIELAKENKYTAVISPSLRRERGQHHRRHRRGDERRPDQDRLAQPHRSRGEVQSTSADRRGTW